MKIRYFKNMTVRRKQRENKDDLHQYERRVRIAKWHRKFAWRPLKISTPDDDNEHSTIVWFETVIQKGRIVEYGSPQFDKTVWIRYTEKEYFRKKLDGTLEREETFKDYEDFSLAGGGPNITLQGGQGGGQVIKKGGPHTSGNKLGGPVIKKGGPSIGSPK